jgi:hypothetical protein
LQYHGAAIRGEVNVEITAKTRVYDILAEYGDIADVMEVFGVKRVGPLSLRKVITRFIDVEKAARVHKVPLDEMLAKLRKAAAATGESQG